MIDPQTIQDLLQTLSEYTEDLRTYQQLSRDAVVLKGSTSIVLDRNSV